MHINQSVSFLAIFLLLSLSCVTAEETTIHVIDVGTGDAVLVESAGKYALIDAGLAVTRRQITWQVIISPAWISFW